MCKKVSIKKCRQNAPLQTFFQILMLMPLIVLSAGENYCCMHINSKTNCNCTVDFLNNCEIICPSIEIKIPIPSVLLLDCKNLFGTISELPVLNGSAIETVVIQNCPLTEKWSISDIIAKWKLNNVRKIVYESNNKAVKSFHLEREHLKGLQGLTYLKLELDETVTLADDVFDDLTNLKILELRTGQAELPANLFFGLKNLTTLYFAPNNATKLPDDIFRNNKKLATLNLRESQIIKLPKEITDQLTSLKDLHLNSATLRAIAPIAAENLVDLTVAFSSIEALPSGLFANTNKLENFCLKANHVPIPTLPKALFANLPVLKAINLSCHLLEIEADTFENSTQIETIALAGNKLTSLPKTLFFHQTELINLILSDNLLSELPENLFLQTTKLKLLKISNNKIEKISSTIFYQLTSLEQLFLDNNHITTIDANAFVSLVRLTELNLQNNRIQLNVTDKLKLLRPLESLQTLNLSNNNIVEMPYGNCFANTSMLKSLDLSHNQITSVDLNEILNNMAYKKIDLSNNQIEMVSYNESLNAERQSEFRQIKFEENPFLCDCQLVGFLQYLQHKVRYDLIIEATNLYCQAPTHLSKRPFLEISPEELYCASENCLNGCQCFEFERTLSLNCNNIDATATLPELRSYVKAYGARHLHIESFEINMENSALAKLPIMSSADFDKVHALRLASNKLTEFNLENLPRKLMQLDLRYNAFKTLSSDVLQHFEKSGSSKSLKLAGNPWQCDCAARPLLEFAQRNFQTLTDRSEMRCALARSSNKSFDNLKLADICTTADTLLIVGLSVLLALFIIFVILCFLYMKFKTEVKVWLYSHRMFLWLITEAELDKDKVFDAFISYSSKDEEFVVKHLVPNLENGTPAFKVCVHYRNFLVGESIPTNIANAVENSRRTIIVLSRNFLESDWALHEFRSAHLAALEEKKPRVIVILYGEIGSKDAIDDELQIYLKTKTYLEWNDPKFWDRLRFAMPHTEAHGASLTLQPVRNGYAIVNGIAPV